MKREVPHDEKANISARLNLIKQTLPDIITNGFFYSVGKKEHTTNETALRNKLNQYDICFLAFFVQKLVVDPYMDIQRVTTLFPNKFHETCMSGAPPVNPLMEFHEECIISCSWCRVLHISHTPYMLVYAYYEGLLLRPLPVSLYK